MSAHTGLGAVVLLPLFGLVEQHLAAVELLLDSGPCRPRKDRYAGAMFGFSRKMFSGSYCALMRLSRVMLARYAVSANAPAASSACPVKFV